MGQVVELDLITTVPIPPEKILTKAIEADLDGCVVVGFGNDGSFYFSSTTSDAGTVMYWLEIAKRKLIDICLDEAP